MGRSNADRMISPGPSFEGALPWLWDTRGAGGRPRIFTFPVGSGGLDNLEVL